jgi:hypothetical protein
MRCGADVRRQSHALDAALVGRCLSTGSRSISRKRCLESAHTSRESGACGSSTIRSGPNLKRAIGKKFLSWGRYLRVVTTCRWSDYPQRLSGSTVQAMKLNYYPETDSLYIDLSEEALVRTRREPACCGAPHNSTLSALGARNAAPSVFHKRHVGRALRSSCNRRGRRLASSRGR